MIRTARLLIVLSVFSMVATAQDDPLAWWPLQVGSRWVYEHEAKSGDRNRPDVDRWRTEQTITGWVTIPEGVVVQREVKQLGSSPQRTERVIEGDGRVGFVQEPDYNRKIRTDRDRQPYLVRGNCLYVISGGWNTQTQQLRPEYRKYLIEGTVSPDFCFPLRVGQKWGNLDIPWRVEPAHDNVGSFLPSEYAGAIHIFSDHFGSGGWEDVWFEKGVGVIGEHYIHNGTYDEITKRLVSR